jgi:hypothetical protein
MPKLTPRPDTTDFSKLTCTKGGPRSAPNGPVLQMSAHIVRSALCLTALGWTATFRNDDVTSVTVGEGYWGWWAAPTTRRAHSRRPVVHLCGEPNRVPGEPDDRREPDHRRVQLGPVRAVGRHGNRHVAR